ncbi:MAG: sulfurtransferase-like selenium metabolism protein YedF [Bacteroidota bacterium]|nr:sulfurtransferase-like selenium metabolism protein YedF [Bacteroidota bacterium]
MKILDVIGKRCPLPLIETKKALKDLPEGEALKVITDSETSKNNVSRFLQDNNIKSDWSKSGDVFEILINYQAADLEDVRAEDYCIIDPPTDKGFVIVFTKDYLGEGSEELGKILINGYLDTLIANEKLPVKMMFFNSGVLMTLKDSAQLEMIKELEDAGVEMLVCGTCLEFFDKTRDLAVGKISNMYEILDGMISTAKILTV